jgi:hypothetical protein
MTLGFFFALLILAFGADKYNRYKVDQQKNKDEKEEDERREMIAIKKTHLRKIAKELGDATIIEVAQGFAGDRVP